jgi:hypothetical protein
LVEPDDARRLPDITRDGAYEFFAGARALLGDRFGDGRSNPDEGVMLTVIGLTDDDVAELSAASAQLGIAAWTHVERADPADLRAWEQLRRDLLDLRNADPKVLQIYPTPNPGYRRPPIQIQLKPHAADTAADLWERYGEFVELQVGAQPFPADRGVTATRTRRRRELERETIDPSELSVALDGPLTVVSGHSIEHGLLVSNRSQHSIALTTNRMLTAVILDPVTGLVVGGSIAPHRQPRLVITIIAGETVRVRLLVGTASFDPILGYALPAGTWDLAVPLELADGRQLVTPALPFIVTESG